MRGNRRRKMRVLSAAGVTTALLVASVVAAPALADVTIEDPGTFVVDRANIIAPADEAQMNGFLKELEDKTGAQVKVLTVPTTEGEDIDSFAFRHAEKWKLGRAGKDNGALIALAVKERHVKIETGYGLEGVLPDSWCGSASRQVAQQYFEHGEYSAGLRDLALTVANKVASAANVSLSTSGQTPMVVRVRRGPPPGAFCGAGLMPLILLVIIFSAMSRRRRYYNSWGGGGLLQGLFWGSIFSNMMRGGGGGWSGGGGWGGGGFGGGPSGGGSGGQG
ncbi:MAG TPA: TPM domain-containing protein, partial [Phycisphaerae bacterium]|nr:TPM domain-containing protein [Phycisphaerae bacterium]